MNFSGNLDEALDQLTEAILLNPQSAILYATRGTHSLCIPTRIKCLSINSFQYFFFFAFCIIWKSRFLVFS